MPHRRRGTDHSRAGFFTIYRILQAIYRPNLSAARVLANAPRTDSHPFRLTALPRAFRAPSQSAGSGLLVFLLLLLDSLEPADAPEQHAKTCQESPDSNGPCPVERKPEIFHGRLPQKHRGTPSENCVSSLERSRAEGNVIQRESARRSVRRLDGLAGTAEPDEQCRGRDGTSHITRRPRGHDRSPPGAAPALA